MVYRGGFGGKYLIYVGESLLIMSSRYDFTLWSCHSSRWREKCSLLQPKPREGAIPLQANLQQVGL